MKRLIDSFALGLAFLSFVSVAAAQSLTTGAITGTVVDQSGAVMASVLVTVQNIDTGATRESETNTNGVYLVAQLDPGRYIVTGASNGFKETQIGPVTVAVSRIATVNLNLRLGSTAEKVVVHEEAQLAEPSNPNTTTTLNETQLANIPNPGNDLSYVANFSPGSVMNVASTTRSGVGNVEFNGLPAVANNFSIDGLDSTDPEANTNIAGASNLQLGLNAIAEVSINTASYSVDQGRQEAAQINYVTKSGTNNFHGNLYETWNGSAMNARNYFNNAFGVKKKPRSNVNEFGSSIGGPILKNKLFFFADLEGIRIILPSTLTSTLPSPAYQAYVLQQLPIGGTDTVFGMQLPPQPAEVPLYQSMFKLMGDTSGGVPLAVLGCPLNANGSPAQGSPPDGDGCANRKTFSVAPPDSETLFTMRLDYVLSRKDTLWFKFQANNGSFIAPDPVNSIYDAVFSAPIRSGAAGWTHIFGPSLVNQFNPGITYNESLSNIADPSKAHAIPITYAPSPFSTIGGFQSFAPAGYANTIWQLNDNLSWNHAKHAFKFGENTRRVLTSNFTTSNFAIPVEAGCTLPEFTFGATCFTTQSFPKTNGDRLALVNLDLYAMDTFKATSKLTLTIGMRTAWNSDPVSEHSAFSRLSSPFGTISHDVNQPLNQVIIPNQRRLFVSTPLLQWQPRAALAYEPMPKTVLRAGFGVFATTLEGALTGHLSGNLPLDPTFSGGIFGPVGGIGIAPGVPGSAVDAAVAANQQFQANFAGGALSCASPNASATTCIPPPAFNGFSGNQQPYPYSMQWSSGVERQFGNDFGLTIRYLGTRGLKMLYLTTPNAYQGWCQSCFAPLPFNAPPDPRFGSVGILNSGANSSYHGLQVTGQKRMSHGLSLSVNYTYSHCLDTGSNGGFQFFNAGSIGPVLGGNLKRYYGNCDYDVRHSLNAWYMYEMPVHPRRAWLNNTIGGWQVSGTVFVRGGFPFSVFSSGRFGQNFFNGSPSLLASSVPGQNPYMHTAIPGVTFPGSIQWLNPNAFQSPIDPTTGTCFPTTNVQNCQDGGTARNAFRAPGFRWTDLDIGKRFKISEGVGLKFDAQFYNLFNHPNFSYPNSGAPTAGIPGKTASVRFFGIITQTVFPSTGLLGHIGGDSSVRMIAFRGRIDF